MTDHRSLWRRIADALALPVVPALIGVLAAAGAAHAQAAPARKVSDAPVAPPSQLAPVDSVTSHGVRFDRLEQRVDGHRVLGAQAVVVDGPGTRGDALVDDTRPRLATPPDATLARADAIARARDVADVTVLRADPQTELAVLPLAGGPRLVWRVVLPAREPLATPEVLVDARSGAIRGVRDLLQHATGTANLYDPNPVAQQGSSAGVADNGDADSSALTSLRLPVTLPRLTDSNTCLQGQWVRATLPPNADVCAGGRDFTGFTRTDSEFEALMAYFHLDRAQAYVQSLGFTSIVNRQLRVRVNDISQDNSFFDPSTGEISTGTGGVDDGEDADVLVHEYGHALQNDQVPGFPASDQAGAMSEGWADYLQAALSATYSPNHALDACMGEWDALSLGVPCLRRLDTALTVSDVWTGTTCNAEIHCASQPWSGALWAIRAAIGPAADTLAFQANFALTPGASFDQGARTVLAADRQLYAGSHRDLIVNALATRGLIDAERVDDEPPDGLALAVPGSAKGHLAIGTDDHDVYAIALAAGQSIVARVTAAAGDFDLRILKPGTKQVFESGAVLANVSTLGAVESLSYEAPSAGTYYVDVTVRAGTGDYALALLGDGDGDLRADVEDDCPLVANVGQEDRDKDGVGDVCDRFADDPANDADADGRGADADNCPANANADQADWDRDKRGDACDRSARVGVTRIAVRGRRITLTGVLNPRSVKVSAWRARIQRQVCKDGRCRYRQFREVRGKKRLSNGRVTVTLRLPAGRYRVRAVLRTKAYKARAGALRGLLVR